MTHHLVGMQEIAQILGVSRQRVAQLVASYDDFPAPEVELAGGRVWSRTAVETWIANHGDRGPGRPETEEAKGREKTGLAKRISRLTSGRGMFERFTDLARASVVKAQEEARLLGHNYIGTEHLLLGLRSVDDGVATRVLEDLDISLETLRARITEMTGMGKDAPHGHIPFTPRSKTVLETALREALMLGHNYIGTEHVLLGLLTEGQGVGVQVIEALGHDPMSVRAKIFAELARTLATLRERGVAPVSAKGDDLVCSFCGKASAEVTKLIAGPGVYICDECIAECQAIVDSEMRPDPVEERLEALEARVRELEGRSERDD